MKEDTEATEETLSAPDIQEGDQIESMFGLPPTPPVSETVEIELSNIIIDGDTQSRVTLDQSLIGEYADIVKACIKDEQPIPFPPATVFRTPEGKIYLADGFHRYYGHQKGGAKEIECEIRNGSEYDAFLFSLGANGAHGLRRSVKDKQYAVKRAFRDSQLITLSDAEIARLCGVSDTMVRNARPAAKAPAVRTVKKADGKTYQVDTSAIGKGRGAKGVKAKAAAAKKSAKAAAKKNGTKPTAEDKPSAPKVDESIERDKILNGIITNVGATEGGKFRAGVLDGALPHVTMKDLREMSTFAKDKQRAILPLIMGGARMKVAKAFDFITSELSAKVTDELHNRALAGGGTFKFEGEGFSIVVKIVKPEAAK